MVRITLQFVVPAGFRKGDYAKLFSDAGGGGIDYNTPVDNRIYELFPAGAGIYGFGHAPFGRFRFGHGHAMRAIGFGHLPFGHFPFGLGSAQITATHKVTECGTYKYAFKVYDAAGNPQSGDPEEVSLTVDTAPAKPAGLKKQSYNKTTDVLTLEVAS